jgi:transaldolase
VRAEDLPLKFSLDTANLEERNKGAARAIVDGVANNPTLIAPEGRPVEELGPPAHVKG